MEFINPIIVDNSVFWLIAGGLVSLGVTIVMFEVSRLFKLVQAVREVKDEMADIRRDIEDIKSDLKQFNRDNVQDHGMLKQALSEHSKDNEHDFDGVKDRLTRLEVLTNK